jgi:hypothetical protein
VHLFFWGNFGASFGIIADSLSYGLSPLLSSLEQLQQFGKPTWHPYNFGKTRKIGLQQFGKPTWQK